jgi:hypothetical protein
VDAVGDRGLCGRPRPVGAVCASTGPAASMPYAAVLWRSKAAGLIRPSVECRRLVVEHLDVVDQRHLRVAVAREALGLFALDGREEGPHHGVVAVGPNDSRCT